MKFFKIVLCMFIMLSVSGCTNTTNNDNPQDNQDISELKAAIEKGAMESVQNTDKVVVTDVTLEDKHLYIKLDISKIEPSAPFDLSDSAVAIHDYVAGAVIENKEFDELWNTITIEYLNVCKITCLKEEMVENEYGRYFPDIRLESVN